MNVKQEDRGRCGVALRGQTRWKQAERLACKDGLRSLTGYDDLTCRIATYLDRYRRKPDGASRAVNKLSLLIVSAAFAVEDFSDVVCPVILIPGGSFL